MLLLGLPTHRPPMCLSAGHLLFKAVFFLSSWEQRIVYKVAWLTEAVSEAGFGRWELCGRSSS